jgi:hypothetical protein
MRIRVSHLVRGIALCFLTIGSVWLTDWRLISSPSIHPQPPVRVVNLESLIAASADAAPHQYLAVRANNSGLFVWMESGASHVPAIGL